jgi:hypothetical protein
VNRTIAWQGGSKVKQINRWLAKMSGGVEGEVRNDFFEGGLRGAGVSCWWLN